MQLSLIITLLSFILLGINCSIVNQAPSPFPDLIKDQLYGRRAASEEELAKYYDIHGNEYDDFPVLKTLSEINDASEATIIDENAQSLPINSFHPKQSTSKAVHLYDLNFDALMDRIIWMILGDLSIA